MAAVMQVERDLGNDPRDVSRDNVGYDIESVPPGAGRLRFLEVKGRHTGATTVTVTKNEILTALNKPEDFILALVEVDGPTRRVSYVKEPFRREPDFDVTSVTYQLEPLSQRATASFVVRDGRGDERVDGKADGQASARVEEGFKHE